MALPKLETSPTPCEHWDPDPLYWGRLGEAAKILRAMQSSADYREVRREGWGWDSLQHRVFASEVLIQEWLQSSEERRLSLDLHPKARLLYKWKEHCFRNICVP